MCVCVLCECERRRLRRAQLTALIRAAKQRLSINGRVAGCENDDDTPITRLSTQTPTARNTAPGESTVPRFVKSLTTSAETTGCACVGACAHAHPRRCFTCNGAPRLLQQRDRPVAVGALVEHERDARRARAPQEQKYGSRRLQRADDATGRFKVAQLRRHAPPTRVSKARAATPQGEPRERSAAPLARISR